MKQPVPLQARYEAKISIKGFMVGVVTHLRKNTHLQVVLSLIAPPMSGPSTLERAKTDEMMAAYVAYFAGGTMRGIIIVDSAYIPEPPIP